MRVIRQRFPRRESSQKQSIAKRPENLRGALMFMSVVVCIAQGPRQAVACAAHLVSDALPVVESAGKACVPAACRPVGGQCSEALQADVPVAAGNLVAVDDGEGAVGSRDKQFGAPIRGKGHSNGRKQPWRMSRPNRRNLTAGVPRGGQEQ